MMKPLRYQYADDLIIIGTKVSALQPFCCHIDNLEKLVYGI